MAAPMNPLIAACHYNQFLKTTALIVTVLATLSGCAKSPKSFEQLSEEERLNFLRAQADNAMLVQATNGVPNIHAVP